MRSILVTGGAGFMGSAFVRYVRSFFEGEIVVLDAMTYAADLKRLEGFECVFVRGDINDDTLLRKLYAEYDIDTIVHFAAETHVDRSIADPTDFIRTNVNGTYALLEFVRAHPKVRFHHISTDEVYGSIEEGCFTEESPYAPNSPYSASKAASDHLVRSYGVTYGLAVTISHASNNYGPYQHPEKLIPHMIKCRQEGKPLPVYGEGLQVRDWLHVEDHARAVWTILQKGKIGEVYNIGGENEWRNIDLVRLIDENIVFVTDRPGHDFRYAIDGTKMRSLGWAPEKDFEREIRRLVERRVACVIPARLESKRFPRKVLETLGDRPLLQWAWEGALGTGRFDEVIFAIDAEETADVIRSFGGRYVMTSPDCPSGTHRLIEVMEMGVVDADVWVNWQADEPFISGQMIDDLLQGEGEIWTLSTPLDAGADPHHVKVVTDQEGRAMYFSREAIPHGGPYQKHIGLYAYTVGALRKIAKLPDCDLSKGERLEQLQFLSGGLKILVHETEESSHGIDLKEHLAMAEALVNERSI